MSEEISEIELNPVIANAMGVVDDTSIPQDQANSSKIKWTMPARPAMLEFKMGEAQQQGQRSNPMMHEKKDSERKFKDHAKDQAGQATMKGLGTGASSNEQAQKAMNANALEAVTGGITLERLNIAINWVQNIGMVLLIDIDWPESFKKWFKFLEAFGLFGFFDFSVFGGMSEDVSIALGFLIPAWLIYEFDCGLYREKKRFWVYDAFGLPDGKGALVVSISLPV
ncbi:hypothetical protein TrVE_jg1608 [Triparma verrucosa]|uniref:Uncharacterized protein n=1 Tax=Triparma verrucosa TaxID=1606542 RepID=A0A9W7KUC0_9STRA|nr:hypothetical protein TrVE_jg1608 [Triparma verrucosa]